MKIFKVQQHTPEWLALRLGKPTSSNFDKILTADGKPSKQATKYMYKLAGERLAGQQEEEYTNAHIRRGIALESEARALYGFIKEAVAPCGFYMDDWGRYGASPDGFVGDMGLVEIKCPSMAVHISYLVGNKLPVDYFQQVQGQLLVTGCKWVDFISYYPGIPPLLIRVKRDEAFIEKMQNALNDFCIELDNLTAELKKRG